MLPYIEHPTLDLGFYRVDSFVLLVGAAVVTQYAVVMRRAPRHGLDRLTTSSLLGWAIFLGLLGAHLFDLFVYYPDQFLDDPWLLLQPWQGVSSLGGMLGGIGGLLFVMHRRGLDAAQRLVFVDCLLFALPFTLAIGRLGCALQHDHLGVASQHALAVAFPDGGRFDLGVLEFLYVSLLCIVFLAADLRRWPSGFFLGLFFTLYAPVRFVLDTLRTGDVRYLGWTPGQYLSVLATLAGIAVLVWAFRRREAPAG
ncbi:MAG: prolipoprotein diacylglyceryl transferase [Myxococcota bacterium]